MTRISKNQLLCCVLALVLASLNTTFAYDFEVDGICYNIVNRKEKTAEVTYKFDITEPHLISDEYRGDIVVPETVEYKNTIYKVISIGDYAFAYCTELKTITIPECITSIGYNATLGCIKLKQKFHTDYLIDGFYYQILNATEVKLKCSNSENFCSDSIVIPESVIINGKSLSVTSIDDYAFRNCNEIKSITIPCCIKLIGKEAFVGCTALKEIYCYTTKPPTIQKNTFCNYQITLYVLAESLRLYKSEKYWSNFRSIRYLY